MAKTTAVKQSLYVPVTFIAVLLFSSQASAAPVTLRFEAIVGPPRAGFEDDIGLPFSFAEGDAIAGKFTFEPLDVPTSVMRTDVVQLFPVEITIDGFSFEADRYLLSVDDNLSGVDAPIPTDIISIGFGFCNSVGCSPQTVGDAGSAEFSLLISFFGGFSTLDGADIPSEESVWESFDFNNASSVLLGFRDPSNQKLEGLIAYITAVHIVPEPTEATLIATGGVIIAILRHRMLRH